MSASKLKARVLDAEQIERALIRISHELCESNTAADLVLIGIPSHGDDLASRIAAIISELEGIEVPVGVMDTTLYRDDIDGSPSRPVRQTSIPDIDAKVVVLVDDVLYTGRTVRAALDALSDHGRPAAVRLAVLIDRGHRELPIRPDHVGKNLPTSQHETVVVRLGTDEGVEIHER